MTDYSSFSQWYAEGRLAPYVKEMRSPGTSLDLLESAQPAGDVSPPAVPELVLVQTLAINGRVSGDVGWGRFDDIGEKGKFFLDAPDFATRVLVDSSHEIRSLSFPLINESVQIGLGCDR